MTSSTPDRALPRGRHTRRHLALVNSGSEQAPAPDAAAAPAVPAAAAAPKDDLAERMARRTGPSGGTIRALIAVGALAAAAAVMNVTDAAALVGGDPSAQPEATVPDVTLPDSAAPATPTRPAQPAHPAGHKTTRKAPAAPVTEPQQAAHTAAEPPVAPAAAKPATSRPAHAAPAAEEPPIVSAAYIAPKGPGRHRRDDDDHNHAEHTRAGHHCDHQHPAGHHCDHHPGRGRHRRDIVAQPTEIVITGDIAGLVVNA